MNELVKPTLNIDLDIKLPEIAPIEHNLGLVEEWVKKSDEFYTKLVFDSTQYSEATAERTKINKLKKQIEDNRKNIVKQYKEPIDSFEATSKRIEKGLEAISSKLGQKIEVFELEEKKKKEVEILKKIDIIREEYIQTYQEYGKPIKEYTILFDNRWFNKTYKDKDLDSDIRTQFNEVVDDLDNFKRDAETISNYFNAVDTEHKLNKEKYVERYKFTRDVNAVMADIKNDLDNLKAVIGKTEVFKEVAVIEEVDPFAGLSVETKPIPMVPLNVFCPEDKIEIFKKFAIANGIEIRVCK